VASHKIRFTHQKG